MTYKIKGVDVWEICILCQQTSPKRWFGNMEITLNCDVTDSAHQIQMTTIWPWTKPPPWKFSANATEWNTLLRELHIPSALTIIILERYSAFFQKCDVALWSDFASCLTEPTITTTIKSVNLWVPWIRKMSTNNFLLRSKLPKWYETWSDATTYQKYCFIHTPTRRYNLTN